MNRSIFALVMFLLACAVLAVPAPRSFPAGLSKYVDLDRDCKLRRSKDALIIEMPGTDHDYDPHRERWNAPQLLRDLEGDFRMQVHVRIDCRPSAPSTVQDQPSLVAAGFLIIPPEEFHTRCIRLEYGVSHEGIGEDGYAALRTRSLKKGKMNATWDRGWKGWPLPEKTDHAYLRLERRGENFYPSISPDGEKWTSLVGPMGFRDLPAKLKLGLAAYSTSTEPSTIRFDRIKLIRSQKKGEKAEEKAVQTRKQGRG